MIGLQWRPGKERRKPQSRPVVISDGPATPDVERAAPPFDPLSAYFDLPREAPRRKPGRPKGSRNK